MILPALVFPVIDPVAVAIGPFAIRWYALAYIAGILIGWKYAVWLARRQPVFFEAKLFDDLVFYATMGIVLGGRLGYIFFYNPAYYASHPLEVFMVWQGGMSFHGGFLGVVVATAMFARKVGAPMLAVGDLVAAAAPVGLFFGRIANFINAELFGRTAPDVPWAMAFPNGGPIPRHPSQLYEATLEGLVLFAVLFVLARNEAIRRRPGIVIGAFLAGYGIARSICEFFREPDAQLGFILPHVTMGQVLSLPMIVVGGLIVLWAARQDPVRAK